MCVLSAERHVTTKSEARSDPRNFAARGPVIFVELLGVVRTNLLQQLFKSSGRTFVQLNERCLLHRVPM